MAYDFLNETTFSKDLEEQQNILNMMQSSSNDNLEEINIPDDQDIVEILQQDDEEPENLQSEQQSNDDSFDFENEDITNDDMEIMSFLFQKKDDSEGSGSLGYANNVISPNQLNGDLSWLKTKSNNVKLNSLGSPISKYLNTLPENLRQKMVATSGNDQQHTKNSRHYQDRAIDLRYDQNLYDYIKNDPNRTKLGLRLLDPNHGTAQHIHLDFQYGGKYELDEAKTGIHIKPENRGKFTASAKRAGMGVQEFARHVLANKGNYSSTLVKRANFARNASKWHHQYGGDTLHANTKEELYNGLNNPNYNNAVLNLSGSNTIRGLDNNQPVAVTDGNKYRILKGSNDTDIFKGKVYETRL